MFNWTDIITMVFGSFVRAMLASAGTFLAAHGATADQTAAFVSNGFDFTIGALVIGATILWSYISKKKALFATPPNAR